MSEASKALCADARASVTRATTPAGPERSRRRARVASIGRRVAPARTAHDLDMTNEMGRAGRVVDYAAAMGPTRPSDPWSPTWQPDPSGRRLASDPRGAARHGASVCWPISAWLPSPSPVRRTDRPLLGIGLLVGVPAVMLLGAGLASAANGSRIDAAAVAVAFAIGMPVAAVTSLVIAGWILDGFAAGRLDIAGDVLGAACPRRAGRAGRGARRDRLGGCGPPLGRSTRPPAPPAASVE